MDEKTELLFATFQAFVVFAECLLLFIIFWLVFRLFKCRKLARNISFALLSYPGILTAGGGSTGFAVPIPILLGAPVWLTLSLFPAEQSTGWAAWLPAPLFAASQDWNDFWLYQELAMLLAWVFVIAVVILVQVRSERKRTPNE